MAALIPRPLGIRGAEEIASDRDRVGVCALGMAVPDSPKFRELISVWADAPLVLRVAVRFLTVSANGAVSGLDDVLGSC